MSASVAGPARERAPTPWPAPSIETEVLLGGEAAIFRADIPERLAGRTLRELERPGELVAIAVERNGRVPLAVPELILLGGDVLHVAAVHRDDIAGLVGP